MSEESKQIGDFGKLLPVTGGSMLVRRDGELEMLLRYLRSSRPCGTCLDGPHGCGKTALIEAAAKSDVGSWKPPPAICSWGLKWLAKWKPA